MLYRDRSTKTVQLDRPGYVLIAVLLVVVVLSLTAYRFADGMGSEFQVAYRSTEVAQSRAFAISGIHYAAGALSDPESFANILNSNAYDNPDSMSNISVGPASPRGGGRFSQMNVVDTGPENGSARFLTQNGVVDESGKINLNAMMRIDSTGESLYAMLILVPNMTPEIADAIIDWLDEDDEPRAAGAESSSYADYAPKNGPLNSIDELLLVSGVTAELLYGNDRNRNGQLDANEDDGNELNRGWSDFFTIYGRELNVDSTGAPKYYINEADLTTINTDLVALVGQEVADYVAAYRLYSVSPSTVGLRSTSKLGTTADLQTAVANSLKSSPKAKRSIPNSILTLVNTRVSLPKPPNAPPDTQTIVIDSPLNNPENLKIIMANLLDKTTCKKGYELNPRINVNTAPAPLLAVLPGVTEADVSAAISARANLSPGSPEYATGSWLVSQGGMRPDIYRQIERYITGYSQTYRVHSIGYFANGGPVARVEAVIDTNQGHPRIIYYRDLTELGGGFTPPR